MIFLTIKTTGESLLEPGYLLLPQHTRKESNMYTNVAELKCMYVESLKMKLLYIVHSIEVLYVDFYEALFYEDGSRRFKGKKRHNLI